MLYLALPNNQRRFVFLIVDDFIKNFREWDKVLMPKLNLSFRGHGGSQQDAICRRRQEAETVQIERALDPEGLRRQFRQTGKGVAAMMSDGGIERAEQPLMRRRQHDHSAAGSQAAGGNGQLGAIVFDMFQHVDIKDGVETIAGGEIP